MASCINKWVAIPWDGNLFHARRNSIALSNINLA